MNKYAIKLAGTLCTGALLLGCLSGCGHSDLHELLYGTTQDELLLKESIAPTDAEPEETTTEDTTEAEDTTQIELEPTTKPQKPLDGEIVANTLNIRKEPSTDSKIMGGLTRGDRVTVTERRKVGDMVWGKIEEGWISMEFVGIDGEVEGNWYQQLEKDEGEYRYRIWEFDAEGNFQYRDYLLMEADEFDYADRENEGGGTYTLEDDQLTLRFTRGEKVLICGEEQRVPGTKELSVEIKGGTVKLAEKETWNRGSLETVQESLLRVLQQKKEEEAKWIRGTWSDIKVDKEANTVHLGDTWTFKKDGTFEYVSQDEVYTYSKENGLEKQEDQSTEFDSFKGTYQLEGKKLKLEYTGEDDKKIKLELEAVQKKGQLSLTDDGETKLYTGKTLEKYVEGAYAE